MGQINPELVVQSLSRVWLFVTPWTAACQASPFFTVSQSLPKLMSIESLTLSNHLILCRPLLLPSIFPSIRVFSNESASGGQSTSVSAPASVLPMNIQDWSPLGWTSLVSLQSKRLSTPQFSNTTVQKHQFLVLSFLRASLIGQLVKNPPAMQEEQVWFLGGRRRW